MLSQIDAFLSNLEEYAGDAKDLEGMLLFSFSNCFFIEESFAFAKLLVIGGTLNDLSDRNKISLVTVGYLITSVSISRKCCFDMNGESVNENSLHVNQPWFQGKEKSIVL